MSVKREDIRGLVNLSPFKPFRLHLADGKDLHVPHPDFALMTASYLVVANELPGGVPGDVNLVPYEHIVRIKMLPRRARKAA
ncbi:MAG: hypothetical protein C5B50_21360 [Verrucomicrobia bacterium]|nr:MAG: hypothetical protein C5B50_21360 [Verrucomicrobiota bacterium]